MRMDIGRSLFCFDDALLVSGILPEKGQSAHSEQFFRPICILLGHLPLLLVDMLINKQKNFMDKYAVEDDLELVNRAQSGSIEAVGLLFDKHYRSMFRYFYARVGQQQQAEDLAGELFTRMVSHLPAFQPSGVPFRAWLFRIAYNLTMDHFRVGNGKELASLDQATMLAQPEQNPVQQVEQQMTRDMLQTALETLVPEQRQVIILRFLVGLSLQETADVLERTLSAVKAMQHRGLKTMRMSLAQVEL